MHGITFRRWLSRLLTWQGRALIAAATLAGALIAVFRATQPDTRSLRIQSDFTVLDASSPTFERLLELYAGARFANGNTVEILLNGDGTYPHLWNDLRSARRSIVVQSYYSMPGAMADTLSTILRAKARTGVPVLVLLDAFGSHAMPEQWIDDLRSAGVKVSLLRPLRWHSLHGAADRSHVRAIVIDGRVGYTGGFGFADYWSGDGRAHGEWRETNVRVRGPAAMQLFAVFAAGWLEATGELITSNLLVGDSPAAPHDRGSGVRAGLLFTTTTTGSTEAERFVILALLSARRRLYITNSYFVPNDDLRRLLADAVARGVDVRILTAGPHTDIRTTRYASRRHYEQLLRAGIRIYEYQAAMMHAKTLSVDGIWSAIGSMNFDNRSLAFNDESTLIMLDEGLSAEMDSVFLDDVRRAREVTLPDFLRRSRWERVMETGAHLLSALL